MKYGFDKSFFNSFQGQFKKNLDECRNKDSCNDLAVSSVKIEIVEIKGIKLFSV